MVKYWFLRDEAVHTNNTIGTECRIFPDLSHATKQGQTEVLDFRNCFFENVLQFT